MKFSIYILLILSVGILSLHNYGLKKKNRNSPMEVAFITVQAPTAEQRSSFPFELKGINKEYPGLVFKLKSNSAPLTKEEIDIISPYFILQDDTTFILPIYSVRSVRQIIEQGWFDKEYLTLGVAKTDNEKPATVKIFFEIGHGKKSRDELSKTVNVLKSGIQEEINTVKTTKKLMMKYESSKKAKKVSKNTKEAQDLEKDKITAELQQLGQDKLKEEREIDALQKKMDDLQNQLNQAVQRHNAIIESIDTKNTTLSIIKPLITARKQKSFYKAKIEYL